MVSDTAFGRHIFLNSLLAGAVESGRRLVNGASLAWGDVGGGWTSVNGVRYGLRPKDIFKQLVGGGVREVSRYWESVAVICLKVA